MLSGILRIAQRSSLWKHPYSQANSTAPLDNLPSLEDNFYRRIKSEHR